MKRLLLLALLPLAGCALGLHSGEHYEKVAQEATPYEDAIARCTDQMRAANLAQAGSLSGEIESRKNFSRGCMLQEGWVAVTADGTRLPPPPVPRPGPQWQPISNTHEDFRVATAKCRMAEATLPDTPPLPGTGIGIAVQNAGNVFSDIALRQAYMTNCMVAQGWEMR
jgi:hypothetical protein